MPEQEVNLVEIMDKAKLRSFQVGVIIICFALIMVDGFDTQSIAFVAPALRHTWEISPNTFGLLFSAGLLGSMIGAMSLGPVGDRLGRKPLILASTLLFGIMSILSAGSSSVEMLATYRFIGGLGLGGLLPNAIALVAEYSPRRVRSTTIVATFIGFPVGRRYWRYGKCAYYSRVWLGNGFHHRRYLAVNPAGYRLVPASGVDQVSGA